jgi:hypothetical protein
VGRFLFLLELIVAMAIKHEAIQHVFFTYEQDIFLAFS